MSELITNNNWNFESSSDNVSEQLDWVNKQVIKELSDLQKEVKDNANIKKTFFNVDTEKKTVTYDMALVKDYLQSCINKEEFQINSAVVMAVQIVLESKWYDVGKIDWLLKNSKWTLSLTEQAIGKFQKENWLRVDRIPWRNTVKKILENLWNIPVVPQKSEQQDNTWWNNNENTLDVEQENLIKMVALEIYRWKVMTNEEIKAKGYDPKEVRKRVKNTSEMERLDRIIPKNIRYEQVSDDISNREVPTPKVDNDWHNTSNLDVIPETQNIQIDLDDDGYVKNLDAILKAKNLELPKLKASNPSEIWWFWNYLMHWFQSYGKNPDKYFGNMVWLKDKNTTTHLNRFNSEADVKRYREEHRDIKSFVLCFWWEVLNNEQTIKDFENWSKWLSNNGIEPVLCTCIGVDTHIAKNEEFKNVGGKRLEPLNNDIRKLANKSKWKYKLIDFAKVDDIIEESQDDITPKSYALMHDIIYKCIEK